MKNYRMLAVSSLALAIALGGGMFGISQAEAETGTETLQSQLEIGKFNRDWKVGPRSGHSGFASEEISDLLGLTAVELKDQLKSGKTLAAIAETNGVEVQAIINLQVKKMTAMLDKQLTDGKITQEQYDIRKTQFTEHAAKMVNGEFVGKGGSRGKNLFKGPGPRGGHFGFASEELADLLGTTTDELKDQLKSGETLAALAEEQGIEVQAIIDLQVENVTAALDKQLTEGKITQEQYDSRKAQITTQIEKTVNGEFTGKRGFGGKDGFRGKGPHAGHFERSKEANSGS